MTEEKNRLNQALSAIRTDKPSEATIRDAASRVRAKLDEAEQPKALNSIEDYIALVPDYLADGLPPAQRLLFEEESRRSVPLRRALNAARSPEPVRPQVRSGVKMRWYAIAAAVVAVAVSLTIVRDLPSPDQTQLVRVDQIEGRLYHLKDGSMEVLEPGAWIDGREALRTGMESSALLVLDDGSRLELDARSELSVIRRFSGNRIDVNRGQIIVEASPQGSGTLDVTTDEFIVSVTGTIFQVGHGAMGSRVSVIEGEVQVLQQGDSQALTPGERMDSRTGFALIDTESGIAWSQDADTYIEMLREVAVLQKDINAALATEKRYSTRLLDSMPADTALYIAVPNAPEKIAEIYDIVRERMQQGNRLSVVWAEIESGSDGHLDEVMTWLRTVGDALGEETALAVVIDQDEEGLVPVPVVLSEVNADAFRTAIKQSMAELSAHLSAQGHQESSEIALIDAPGEAKEGQLNVLLQGDLLIASISPEVLQEIAEGAAGFTGSAFHSLLRDSYTNGAEFLGGVHVARILASVEEGHRELEVAGIDNAEFLIAERQQNGDLASIQADLVFSGQRSGVAAWLAAPGPMGSLEFFSYDATFAAAAVVKAPEVILSEFQQMVVAMKPEADLDEVFAELDLREDLIPALGGEVAFGLDGTMVPTPEWKVIVEVFDGPRLQQGIQRIVDRLNQELVSQQADAAFTLTAAEVSGYEGWQVSVEGQMEGLPDVSIHYAYVDGYLVMAPNDALVERAVDYYKSGVSVLSNDSFRALLPSDGHLDFSAVAFNRLAEMMSDMLAKLPSGLTGEQQQVVAEITQTSGPSLYSVYGEPDRIRFVQNGNAELPFNITQLMSLGTLLRSSEFSAVLDGAGVP